ncbi:hypothetical protein [Aneurinibacillus tyrosinisolvens]|uniref:hypothetical protein n=1 Tax=Aneurinibacillus tyrosinisolvens TaxID=1443435 RepID=UPI000699CB32|nr:hypothetical protein [Aneurinibacillus tyrosinisolvens]
MKGEALSGEDLFRTLLETRKIWHQASIEEKKQMVYILVKKMVVDLPDEQRKNRVRKEIIVRELEFH